MLQSTNLRHLKKSTFYVTLVNKRPIVRYEIYNTAWYWASGNMKLWTADTCTAVFVIKTSEKRYFNCMYVIHVC